MVLFALLNLGKVSKWNEGFPFKLNTTNFLWSKKFYIKTNKSVKKADKCSMIKTQYTWPGTSKITYAFYKIEKIKKGYCGLFCFHQYFCQPQNMVQMASKMKTALQNYLMHSRLYIQNDIIKLLAKGLRFLRNDCNKFFIIKLF